MENKDIFESEWEQDLPPENEIKQIQKSIRKRNLKNITISVVLALAMLLGIVYGIIPSVERLYWNPDDTSYYETDLETTLHAYTQLFTPGYNTAYVSFRHTGFASYDLEIPMVATADGSYSVTYGSLKRNNLHLNTGFDHPSTGTYGFSRRLLPEQPMGEWETAHLRDLLTSLPEYIRLEAVISFSEDLTMEQLLEFRSRHSLLITWVAIRCGDSTENWAPLCGMDPFTGGIKFTGGIERDYPYFNAPINDDPALLGKHFKALLQYCDDRLKEGRGIVPYDDENLYGDILQYVEENGINSYGCLITTTPRELLEMLDSGELFAIHPVNGWIDLK